MRGEFECATMSLYGRVGRPTVIVEIIAPVRNACSANDVGPCNDGAIRCERKILYPELITTPDRTSLSNQEPRTNSTVLLITDTNI